jgi:transcriptional regulator with XRE-family HTH domain
MGQTAQIVERLKRQLRARGITYKRLAAHLGMSEAAIKKTFANHSFTLDRLEAICGAAGIELTELVRSSSAPQDPRYLSEEQEAALAGDDRLFSFLYLLLSGLDCARIAERFDFSRLECSRLLLRLDRLGILEALPGDRFVLKIHQHVWWSLHGPLARRHHRLLKEDFMASDFHGPGERIWFAAGTVSESTLQTIGRLMDRVLHQIHELIELDRTGPGERRRNISLVAAHRPYTMPLLRRLRRPRPDPGLTTDRTASAAATPPGRGRPS